MASNFGLDLTDEAYWIKWTISCLAYVIRAIVQCRPEKSWHFDEQGHDTASTAIAWFIYFMATHPEEQVGFLRNIAMYLGDIVYKEKC